MTTAERLTKLETKIEDINFSLNKHMKEQREDFNRVLEKLDGFDDKFAGKWTEKVLITIVTGVGVAIILMVI